MDVVDALLAQAPRYPQRIVAITEETTETLYRLGLSDRIVGVSCFTLRPKEAKQKPTVSSFLDANFEKIIELKPVDELIVHLRDVAAAAAVRPRRPRVFFEEWPDPCISAIRWVSELIELAGGEDLFKETRARHDAKGRFVAVDGVIARDPDVIIASWCGKKVKRDSIAERYAQTTAVENDAIYEIPSELILQPGPACLTDGVDAIVRILDAVVAGTQLPAAHPGEARRGDCFEL